LAFGKFGKYYPDGGSYRAVPFDLVAAIAAMVGWFRERDGREHVVTFAADTERFQVRTDAQHLRYIVINLLQNAARYSPAGTPIEVVLSTAGAEPRICVSDEGIGVPEAEIEELFSPFYRASNVGDRPGTGMGLPIVKESARLIGATVSVERRSGAGSAFTVTLPGRVGRPPA
jgi:signal transduction histidine kinase